MSKILSALRQVNDTRQSFGFASAVAYPAEGMMNSTIGTALKKMVRPKKDDYLSASSIIEKGYMTDRFNFRYETPLLILVVIVSVASLILSIRTFSEMKSANYTSVVLAKEAVSQKQKVGDLEQLFNQTRKDFSQKVDGLTSEMDALKGQLKDRETKIAQLTATNGQLAKTVEDLKWTSQNLTEKIVNVTSQLNSLKTNPQ